jgi:pilus assembly protein Flp/PilA
MLQRIRRLCRRPHEDEEGASAVEYGLLVGAVAAVIITVVITLGGRVQDMFDDGCSSFGAGGASASC